MKKMLLVSLFFLLKISTINAQSIDTDFAKNIAEKNQNTIVNKQLFIHQIEIFQIKKEDTFTKRRNKGKNKRKSKIRIIFLNLQSIIFVFLSAEKQTISYSTIHKASLNSLKRVLFYSSTYIYYYSF
jgi:hypothetical protein